MNNFSPLLLMPAGVVKNITQPDYRLPALSFVSTMKNLMPCFEQCPVSWCSRHTISLKKLFWLMTWANLVRWNTNHLSNVLRRQCSLSWRVSYFIERPVVGGRGGRHCATQVGMYDWSPSHGSGLMGWLVLPRGKCRGTNLVFRDDRWRSGRSDI